MKRYANKIEIITDPVCGMKVNPNKTDLVVTFQGDSHYFCAEACRDAFEKNPIKFLKPKHRGFWGRYLDRLRKSTDGKPLQCH